MPTASYQSPNDYNLVKEIRPFNQPYEATMQEISTKTQYFKVAADRIKSQYDQAVGLDPQFVQNKEYLRNFMTDANQKLGKITKSDLSVLDNSAEAANIFKPLYDTSNPFNYKLLQDSQLNKFYQKQGQLSDAARIKDGGKDWNQNNEIYFRDAQAKYMNDARNGNTDSLDAHFANKKSYIPYYDFKKEIMDLQENCHGFSNSSKSIAPGNEMYMLEDSKKGCSPAELALAMKTGLSDRAKQQMGIDGYVHFRGNEDTLAQKFTDIAITKPQQTVDAIKATIAGIKEGGVAKDEQARLEYYNNQLAVLEPELKQAKEDYDSMTKGNVIDYVKKNYDRLAGQIYFGDLTNQLATAFRTDETKNIVSANPAGMLKLRLETDRANMYIQDSFDIAGDARNHGYRMDEINLQGQNARDLAELKGEIAGKGTGLGVEFSPVSSVTGKPIEIPEVTERDFIKENLQPKVAAATAAYNVIDDLVGKALGQTTQKLNHEQLSNYVTELKKKELAGEVLTPSAERILSAYKDYAVAKDDLAFVNDQVGAINAEIKAKHPELLNDATYSDDKTVNYSLNIVTPATPNPNVVGGYNPAGITKIPSVPLSEKDIFNILRGQTVNGFAGKMVKNPGIYGSPNSSINERLELTYNGAKVNTDPSLTNNPALLNLFRKVQQKDFGNRSEVDKLKTAYYTDNNYVNSKLTVFNKMDFGKPTDFENQYGEKIKQFLNASGGLNDKNGYEVVGRDRFGSGVYIRQLDEDGKPIGLKPKTFAHLRTTDKGATITEDKDLQAYYIPDFLPNYPNLPDRQTLERFDRVKYQMRNIEKIIGEDPKFKNAITMDTRELPTGGTIRYVGPSNGREYIISAFKQQGKPLQYIATWQIPGTTDEDQLQASSMDQLLPKLR